MRRLTYEIPKAKENSRYLLGESEKWPFVENKAREVFNEEMKEV